VHRLTQIGHLRQERQVLLQQIQGERHSDLQLRLHVIALADQISALEDQLSLAERILLRLDRLRRN